MLFCLQIRGQSPGHALVSFPPWSHAEIRPSGCLHCATKRRDWSNIIINDYNSCCRRHFPISLFLKTFSQQYIHNFGLIFIFKFYFLISDKKVKETHYKLLFPTSTNLQELDLIINLNNCTMTYFTERWYSTSR